jgi:hypothetical protein
MSESGTGRPVPRITAGTRVVARIVLSLLVGGAAYVMTLAVDSEDANTVLGIAVSVFFGGITFVVGFLVGVENRVQALDQTVHSTQAEIRDRVREVSKATQLFSEAKVTGLEDSVTDLIRHASAIRRTSPTLLGDFARHEIDRLAGYLKSLSQSQEAVYDGEDRDWMLGLTEVARESIDATSLTTVDGVDGGLWRSDLGQRYLQAQGKAIRSREVTIRRLFIVDHEPQSEKEKEELDSILAEHHRVGIQVKTLRPRATVIPEPLRPLLIDFIIIDRKLVYLPVPTAQVNNKSLIQRTALSADERRVEKEYERYEMLWNAGQDFVPSVPRPRAPSDEGQSIKA